MGFADEDILVIDDAPRRPRFTIRRLILLVLAVAAVAWAMCLPGSNEFLLKHWPLIALALFPLYGLVWSIRRVYRVTPQQQTISIIGLIVSLLGLLLVPPIYMSLFFFRRSDESRAIGGRMMPRSRHRISTRSLMILTAVIGVDVAVVIQADRIGPGIEFTLFIAAVMGTLNLFFASYMKAADRINAAPPEKQTEMIVTLGCLLMVIMALLMPVLIVILLNVG